MTASPATWHWQRLTGEVEKTQLRSAAQEYSSEDSRVVLEGTLSAEASVAPSGTLLLSTQGELRATNLVAQPRTIRLAWPALAALLVSLPAVAGAAFAYQRHRERSSYTPDECLELAQLAMDRQDDEQALRWLKRGREKAPTSERLMLDEAYLRARLGESDAALELLKRTRGPAAAEAAYMTAMIYLQAQRHREALAAATHALETYPWLADDFATDPLFAELYADSEFRHALRQAKRPGRL